MPFTEDQHLVGDLSPGGEHEPWKKSVASIVDAWVCRNFRHVVSEHRSGAGGIFSALRTLRIVDTPT